LELVQEFPCFSVAAADEAKEAMAFLNQRLVRPDADFASAFERGHYRQDRSFIRAIGATLQRSPIGDWNCSTNNERGSASRARRCNKP